MAGLTAQIANDIAQITGNLSDFAIPVIFTITDGETVVSKTVNANAVSHGLYINENGVPVVSGVARIMVSEINLKNAGFPTRNTKQQLILKGCNVTFTDTVTGIQSTWIINENFGNQMSGLITCTLGSFGAATPPGRIIIGWIAAPITAFITATPGTGTQTLANGDIIPTDYSMNADRTLTIPYMVGYVALTTFLLNGRPIQSVIYTQSLGKFSVAKSGAFNNGDNIKFDASIPIWQ